MSKSSSAPNYSRAVDAPLDVRPITPAIGAEIYGVRLSGDLPAETVTAIRDALLRHRVVFFRGQGHLDEAGHQAFARLLGPLAPHPSVPPLAGILVESRCGAVSVGRTYPFPPLSSGGALAVRPWLRFHISLIEPDVQISGIRLVWAFFVKVSRHFCLPLSFHSFVRPAPPSILPPRPYISIAVGRSGGQ